MAVVAADNLECHHCDIKYAFTESHLKEEIFLAPPDGVHVKKGNVLQLLRSLYGLKKGARDWSSLMQAELLKWDFKQTLADPCLFVHPNGIRLLVYVDDIVAAAKSQILLDWLYSKLSSRFTTKNLGAISKILGVRVSRDRAKRVLHLDQEQYLRTVLDNLGITESSYNPKQVPLTDRPLLLPATPEDPRIDAKEYQQMIGSLMYAMVLTRPDVAFTLGKLCQYMSDLSKHHADALKVILRYLSSTISTMIRYGPVASGQQKLQLLSDADGAKDKANRKSVSGSVAMLYGRPFPKSSRRQRSMATSSCEAEYMAIASCAK